MERRWIHYWITFVFQLYFTDVINAKENVSSDIHDLAEDCSNFIANALAVLH